jgi:phosphatidate cytidylyltransferase
MLTRVLTGVIGLPILIVLVYLGGFVLAAVLILVAAIGFWELYRLYKTPAAAFAALLFVGAPFAAVLIMRESFGIFHVWLIFIAAWGCDTGAYFTGRAFGKRKLAPNLSPNKTVAGAVGGTLIAAALAAAYALILRHLGIWAPGSIIPFAVYGLMGAILAQAGDLTASAIKRRKEIKDFGRIIPGHGGILDRFDSILFVAPFALIFFAVV